MIQPNPALLMVLGFVLLVIGFILPFLMVLQLLESTLLLGFVAYLTSFGGLVLGLMGVVLYARTGRQGGDRP
jgi:hypothetical protein